MKRLRPIALALTLPALVAMAPAIAHAEDVATADALFREGTAKRRANQLNEACALFRESYRLDPAGGTTFALADCLEAQGKLAQAMARYREAGAIARQRRNAEKERLVAERLAALEPRLPTLKVNVPSAWRRLPGLIVTRDDQEMGPPSFGLAVPVDPGPHAVRFSAEGVLPFSTVVMTVERTPSVVDPTEPEPLVAPPNRVDAAPQEIDPQGAGATRLVNEPSAGGGPPRTAPPRPPASTSRTRTIVAGSLGVLGVASAAIAVGSFVGSRRKVDEAAPFCPDACDARGHALYESARTQHYTALGFGGSAVALLTGAAVLGLTDLGKGSPTVTLSPQRLSLAYEASF